LEEDAARILAAMPPAAAAVVEVLKEAVSRSHMHSCLSGIASVRLAQPDRSEMAFSTI
jgi:hypothetical protein